MKRLLLILSIVLVAVLCMASNSKDSSKRHEYATVNADPGASGYFTNSVNAFKEKVEQIYFSVRGSGTMTVTLQFKCPGDASWTDYDTYTSVTRQVIKSNAASVRWRAGVVDSDDYTSGSLTFGFDW